MPISQRLLEQRLNESLNALCWHVQMGAEMPTCLVEALAETIDHTHANDEFFIDNTEQMRACILRLCEYIASLQRPHAFTKQVDASPITLQEAREGLLRAKGGVLLPPTATITAHVDDSGLTKYITLWMNEEKPNAV